MPIVNGPLVVFIIPLVVYPLNLRLILPYNALYIYMFILRASIKKYIITEKGRCLKKSISLPCPETR